MKKIFCILLTALCLTGMLASASAEKGFETLYGLYTSEDVFGEPGTVYDQENDEGVRICFALFFFDTENDMTNVILIGENEQQENKYYAWTTDFEPGFQTMTFLLTKYAMLKETCEKDVDFCVACTFDGGETMAEFNSVEDADAFLALLQNQEESAEAQ